MLGLSARCVGSHPPPPHPTNKLLCGALCFVFDSESIGFAGALARVFERVWACQINILCTFVFGVFSIELEYLIHNWEVYIALYHCFSMVPSSMLYFATITIMQVAVINFSKSYADYENPVHVNVSNSFLVSMTAPHDIVMANYVVQTNKVSV